MNVIREGKELPVAFFSRQLQGAQHRYSATELECLALYKSILHFSHFLVGCRFQVVTDHQALVALLSSKVLNKRLIGWMLQLLDFDFFVTYRPGSRHQDADALSRQSWDPEEGLGDSHPRTVGVLIGGDVGISPHIEEKEEEEEAGSRKDGAGRMQEAHHQENKG